MQNFKSTLKFASNKNRFLKTDRAHHNSSKPHLDSEPPNESPKLLKMYFPIWGTLELGIYGCALYYLNYSIKNKKNNPNIKSEATPKISHTVEPCITPISLEDTSYREGLRPIS